MWNGRWAFSSVETNWYVSGGLWERRWALAAQHTSRIATQDTETLTRQLVTESIHAVFPGVDTTVVDRRPAHADLNWANVTAPVFSVFD